MSPYLSHRRVLPAALAACLALGLGSTAASAAAPAADSGAHAAQAKRGRTRRQATRRATSKRGAFLNGSAAPSRRTGSVGDFYLRTSNRTLYGPKTGRGWGRAVSLVGPTGAQGPQGNPGATGTQGPAGTPAFGNGVATTIAAPAAVTAAYDGAGDLVNSEVEVGTVTVPAGVALVQLRLRVAPGDGYAANDGVAGCAINNATTGVLAAYAFSGQLATDTIGWTTSAGPTTFAIRCSLLAEPRGTPGTTITASVAGTQVVVFGANVPGV